MSDAAHTKAERPGAGFTQDNAQERGRIDVGDHRRRRSSTTSAPLSVCFEGLGGSFRSRGRRRACRTSMDVAATGTIRAIGVSRSSTVTVPPCRTDRRCPLRSAFKSAMRTLRLTNYGHESPRQPIWGRQRRNRCHCGNACRARSVNVNDPAAREPLRAHCCATSDTVCRQAGNNR